MIQARNPVGVERRSTGIPGLDRILGGGLLARHVHLLYGTSGTGKTTVGLQFLLDGAARGESVLYIGFSESKREIEGVALSHGWSLDGVAIYEVPRDYARRMMEPQTLFPPEEVELPEILNPVLELLRRLRPSRVVVDSLAEIRFMAQSQYRYRREVRLLKEVFLELSATVLLLDDRSPDDSEQCVESLLHGIAILEQSWPDYGKERRRLRVVKMRATPFLGGYHDFEIRTGGLHVHPRLLAAPNPPEIVRETLSTGLPELDQLLGGGLETATSVLLLGPAGSGKSNLSTQILSAAMQGGRRGALFGFEETLTTTLSRSQSLGIPLAPHLDAGRLIYHHTNPAELTPGQFVGTVLEAVERHDARVVVLDTLNGYLNSMPDEAYLTLQLHELLVVLQQNNVLTILLLTQHGLLQSVPAAAPEVSYLADVVIGLQPFEYAGKVRRAISVLKKRSGHHDSRIREFMVDNDGIRVGPPLEEFQGILAGPLTYLGPKRSFLEERP